MAEDTNASAGAEGQNAGTAEADGGPAFDRLKQWHVSKYDAATGETTYEGETVEVTAGALTLRDHFAAKALAGLLGYVSKDDWTEGAFKFTSAETYALAAYRIADEMLEARKAGVTS